MSGSDALSAMPDQRLLEFGRTYLLRYLGVRRAAEWRSHWAPVDIRILSTNAGNSQLKWNQGKESYRFEGDIRVPSFFPTLLFLSRHQEGSFVEFLGLARTNDADLIVPSAVVAARVDDGMDMQLGRCRFAGKLPKALGEFFLKGIIQTVLRTEKDDTALGDCVGGR